MIFAVRLSPFSGATITRVMPPTNEVPVTSPFKALAPSGSFAAKRPGGVCGERPGCAETLLGCVEPAFMNTPFGEETWSDRDEDRFRLRICRMNQPKSPFDVIGQLGAMRRYARSLTRDGEEAEDLVQDAFLRAYERRSTFRAGGNLRAWLLSILHNSFIDRVRARRAETVRIEKAGELAPISLDAPQDHVVRLAQVRAAFLTLPEEQRAALHLVTIEGLSYQEAADALGVPVGTLMSRIGRARASLRALENRAQEGPNLRIVGGRDDHGA